MPAITLLLIGFVHNISLNSYRKWWFWIPVSFGLISALLTKITVMYSIPSEVEHPLLETIVPKLMSGELNDGNVFGINPLFGAILLLSLMVVGFTLLLQASKRVETQNL